MAKKEECTLIIIKCPMSPEFVDIVRKLTGTEDGIGTSPVDVVETGIGTTPTGRPRRVYTPEQLKRVSDKQKAVKRKAKKAKAKG